MIVYFAGDHAGLELKKEMMDFVRLLGHEVEDLGPFEPKSGDDYPDYVIPLAKKVAGRESTEVRGIVVAGSGQGEIIAMNRLPGARAALFCPCNLDLVKASRDHNDSNIFAIMGKVRKTLVRNGQRDQADKCVARMKAAGSYDEALGICFDYVEVE